MKISKRHLAKTLTWRGIGSLDTLLLSWLISGNLQTGIKIGVTEIITKMILYYFHERSWYNSSVKNSNKRHFYKTLTWRIIGTTDTIILAWIFTGDPSKGLSIGIAELFTKMVLYYLHEKIWYRFSFGIEKTNKSL